MPKVEQLDEGKKLKVTTDQGEIFEGDPLEVTQKLAASKEEANRFIKTQKSELEELRKPKPAEPPPSSAPTEQDQIRKYLLDEQARALGFKDGEEYKAAVAEVREVTKVTKNKEVILDFMNQCPDFPNTKEASDALAKKVEDMGYTFNAPSLMAAHMLCVRDSAYKPLSESEQSEAWASRMASSGRPSAPPMIRPGSPDASQSAPDLNAMTSEQIKALYFKNLQSEAR